MYGSFSVKVNLDVEGPDPLRSMGTQPLRDGCGSQIRLPASASGGPGVDPYLDTTARTVKGPPCSARAGVALVASPRIFTSDCAPPPPRTATQTLMKIPRADIAHSTPNQKSTVAPAKAREPFRGPAQDANQVS